MPITICLQDVLVDEMGVNHTSARGQTWSRCDYDIFSLFVLYDQSQQFHILLIYFIITYHLQKKPNYNNTHSMENTQRTYTQYLQQLLEKHNIAYEKQGQFAQKNHKSKQQFIKGPLQTNLRSPLFGDILSRYSRQMLLKEIGYEGQLKISTAKVALIGAGGIGCPLGLYLAGAGVGTLGLFDSDIVDMTNLHRQVGHSTHTVGKSKTESLKLSLLNLNPNIVVQEHPFIAKNTLHLLDDYDLVIDGSDNPQCRYLVNDYLMSKHRKLLSGACVGWQGQVTCYGIQSPCYRCIWGDDQVSMGGCSTIGVVGMLPGLVAMVLGTQAIKIIIDGHSSLEGQLLTYEARSCLFRKMKLRNKKTECLACGTHKLRIQDYDYDKYSGCKTEASKLPDVPTIPWAEAITNLKENANIKFIDVRAKGQFDIINIKNTTNIPYDNLIKLTNEQLKEVLTTKDQPIYVSCRMGILSKRASDYLLKHGYTNVTNIEGGITSYGKQFDPNIVNL